MLSAGKLQWIAPPINSPVNPPKSCGSNTWGLANARPPATLSTHPLLLTVVSHPTLQVLLLLLWQLAKVV